MSAMQDLQDMNSYLYNNRLFADISAFYDEPKWGVNRLALGPPMQFTRTNISCFALTANLIAHSTQVCQLGRAQAVPSVANISPSWRFVMDNAMTAFSANREAALIYVERSFSLATLYDAVLAVLLVLILLSVFTLLRCIFWPSVKKVQEMNQGVVGVAKAIPRSALRALYGRYSKAAQSIEMVCNEIEAEADTGSDASSQSSLSDEEAESEGEAAASDAESVDSNLIPTKAMRPRRASVRDAVEHAGSSTLVRHTAPAAFSAAERAALLQRTLDTAGRSNLPPIPLIAIPGSVMESPPSNAAMRGTSTTPTAARRGMGRASADALPPPGSARSGFLPRISAVSPPSADGGTRAPLERGARASMLGRAHMNASATTLTDAAFSDTNDTWGRRPPDMTGGRRRPASAHAGENTPTSAADSVSETDSAAGLRETLDSGSGAVTTTTPHLQNMMLDDRTVT
ncbi:hypothetical protein EON62_01630, partial [archaeon]